MLQLRFLLFSHNYVGHRIQPFIAKVCNVNPGTQYIKSHPHTSSGLEIRPLYNKTAITYFGAPSLFVKLFIRHVVMPIAELS